MKKEIALFLRSGVQLSWAGLVMLLLILALSLFTTFQCKREIMQLKRNEKARNMTSLPDVVRMQSLHQPELSSQEVRQLKKKGLNNPVDDIIADLMKHNELIPFRGVLGGKMGFYSKEGIYVLSTKLVRASFDDGHTNGWILFEYQVTGGKITWKVLESYLE